MKKVIKEQLAAHGACAVGVVRARVFSEIIPILEKRGRVPLCEADNEKRVNPFLIMPNAKAIVVCLFSYCLQKKTKISEYAMGYDYHAVILKKLDDVCKILKESGYEAKAYTDNSPLPERYLAYLAGLGFFGKNNMLINEKYGSKVFIGYIITDCEITQDKPQDNAYCISCGKCISACPGGAIVEDFNFDAEKCVSFLTQKKGELSNKEAQTIKKSGYIWGCDICQNVCPYNVTAPITQIEEFKKDIIPEILDVEMSNKEFREKFGNRAFAWRGKAVIKRNIELYK